MGLQAQILLLTVGKEKGKAALRHSEDSQGDGNKSGGPLR